MDKKQRCAVTLPGSWGLIPLLGGEGDRSSAWAGFQLSWRAQSSSGPWLVAVPVLHGPAAPSPVPAAVHSFQSTVTRCRRTRHLRILHVCDFFFFNVLPLLNVFVSRQPYCLLSTLYSSGSFYLWVVNFPSFLWAIIKKAEFWLIFMVTCLKYMFRDTPAVVQPA